MRIWLVVLAGALDASTVAGTIDAGAAEPDPADEVPVDVGAVHDCVAPVSRMLDSSGVAAATGVAVAMGVVVAGMANAAGVALLAAGMPGRFERLLAIRVRAGGVVEL
jgi:hypothetical protein